LTRDAVRLTFSTIDRKGHAMSRTRVSSKYQIVIPKDVRQTADVRVGQEFQVIAKGGQITLVPDRPIASMRGFVPGMKTNGFREKKDRF
jgi:AbrB family looped-hinge helix DNA binding protein